MKKFSRDTMKSIVSCAIREFMHDTESPDYVCFFWKGYLVQAFFERSPSRCAFYLSEFTVTYTRCVIKYLVDIDFDRSIAWCE